MKKTFEQANAEVLKLDDIVRTSVTGEGGAGSHNDNQGDGDL